MKATPVGVAESGRIGIPSNEDTAAMKATPVGVAEVSASNAAGLVEVAAMKATPVGVAEWFVNWSTFWDVDAPQ